MHKYVEFSAYTCVSPSKVGLDKLSSTKDVVATLQEELTVLQPQLVKTMKEVRSQIGTLQ